MWAEIPMFLSRSILVMILYPKIDFVICLEENERGKPARQTIAH
jgi:hypothetical protein